MRPPTGAAPLLGRAPAPGLALGLALAAGLLAGCLCPPSNEALLAVGYRSPEQTVRTFQTGVRANDPGLEFRCLSAEFRHLNNISQLTYREFRGQLFKRNPFLRTGLAKAKIVSAEQDGARARIVVASFGRRFALELVREDFAQLYADGELVLDTAAPFEQWTSVESTPTELWVTGGAPVPAGRDGHEITELRLGREWKIDDFRGELDEPAATPPARRSPRP